MIIRLCVNRFDDLIGFIRPSIVGIAVFMHQKTKLGGGVGIFRVTHANIILAVAREGYYITKRAASGDGFDFYIGAPGLAAI